MKYFGWISIIIGVLTLFGELDSRHPDVGVQLFMIVLGVIFLIFAYRKEKEEDKTFESIKPQDTFKSNNIFVQTTYWGSYRMQHPSKAKDIENVLGIDLSTLSDQDCQEKIQMVERFSKSLNCSIAELKSAFLKEIDKYPSRILPAMIISTQNYIRSEAALFHISGENTSSFLMTQWLQELYNET